ncbi:MAG: hypothetical protein K2I93_03570 [Oscillospiraceae bacterium]|nr:hypothetical protein [Oscillospiraceae bacterium]
MTAILFIGLTLLLGIGGAVMFALLSTPDTETEEKLQPFAVLPVPDGNPGTEAFLRHYASQVAWMDTQVLRCVLLVYLPEHTDACTLCQDMAREYEVYTAVSLTEMQVQLTEECHRCQLSPNDC